MVQLHSPSGRPLEYLGRRRYAHSLTRPRVIVPGVGAGIAALGAQYLKTWWDFPRRLSDTEQVQISMKQKAAKELARAAKRKAEERIRGYYEKRKKQKKMKPTAAPPTTGPPPTTEPPTTVPPSLETAAPTLRRRRRRQSGFMPKRRYRKSSRRPRGRKRRRRYRRRGRSFASKVRNIIDPPLKYKSLGIGFNVLDVDGASNHVYLPELHEAPTGSGTLYVNGATVQKNYGSSASNSQTDMRDRYKIWELCSRGWLDLLVAQYSANKGHGQDIDFKTHYFKIMKAQQIHHYTNTGNNPVDLTFWKYRYKENQEDMQITDWAAEMWHQDHSTTDGLIFTVMNSPRQCRRMSEKFYIGKPHQVRIEPGETFSFKYTRRNLSVPLYSYNVETGTKAFANLTSGVMVKLKGGQTYDATDYKKTSYGSFGIQCSVDNYYTYRISRMRSHMKVEQFYDDITGGALNEKTMHHASATEATVEAFGSAFP